MEQKTKETLTKMTNSGFPKFFNKSYSYDWESVQMLNAISEELGNIGSSAANRQCIKEKFTALGLKLSKKKAS